MPLQILLICIYRCLRVLAAYWVFKSLLRMSIVVGGACARAKRHTNMIVRAARFAPNKPWQTCISNRVRTLFTSVRN